MQRITVYKIMNIRYQLEKKDTTYMGFFFLFLSKDKDIDTESTHHNLLKHLLLEMEN